MPDDTTLSSLIGQIRDLLDDPSLSPKGMCCNVLDQIAQLEFAPGREAAVANRLREFLVFLATEVIPRARSTDYFLDTRRAATQLSRDARALAQPVQPVAPEDEVKRVYAPLQDLGFASATLELLKRVIRPGEKITGYDCNGVTTTMRRIDRVKLIEDMRPASWTNRESWIREHTRSAILQSRPPQES